MASANFLNYERNVKRLFWMTLLENQHDAARRETFRASLIGMSCTPLPAGPSSALARAMPPTSAS